MAKDKEKVEKIEVKAEVVKPKKKVETFKATPKENIGTYRGKPRFKAGVEASFTKEQIYSLTKQKLI